jgi:hypothetical protein
LIICNPLEKYLECLKKSKWVVQDGAKSAQRSAANIEQPRVLRPTPRQITTGILNVFYSHVHPPTVSTSSIYLRRPHDEAKCYFSSALHLLVMAASAPHHALCAACCCCCVVSRYRALRLKTTSDCMGALPSSSTAPPFEAN